MSREQKTYKIGVKMKPPGGTMLGSPIFSTEECPGCGHELTIEIQARDRKPDEALVADPKRSYGAIAKDLNRKKVPTAHGGERWHASTVRAILKRDR